MKAHLLDSVLNVRTRQCEELKRNDDGAVEGSVGRRRALNGGHLMLGNVVISKKFLRTRKIMVMHSNERGVTKLCTLGRGMDLS